MVMITLATRRRHLNNNNGTTTPLAAPRGSLDPPSNNKDKKHYRRNMNPSNPKLIFSVVSTLLLICTLYHQFLPKLLHEGSHRSMLQTSNLGVRGGMVGIGQSISDSDDSSDAHKYKSLRRVIASTHQVLVVGPAKAAGSSMFYFSSECNNGTSYTYDEMGKFLRRASGESSLTKYYEMPSVVSSHVHNSQTLVNIIKDAPRDTLLLYSHRQETSRLQSAVKQVLQGRVCSKNEHGMIEMYAIKRHGNLCHINEEKLIQLIKSGKNEIGTSTNHLLTCKVYEAIENYAPTMAFIDYQKASEIQELISEKYCPQLLGPVVTNVAAQKKMQVYVWSNTTNANVTLDHWLATKSSTLEFALRLNANATCVSKTRIMEDQLYLNKGILFDPHKIAITNADTVNGDVQPVV